MSNGYNNNYGYQDQGYGGGYNQGYQQVPELEHDQQQAHGHHHNQYAHDAAPANGSSHHQQHDQHGYYDSGAPEEAPGDSGHYGSQSYAQGDYYAQPQRTHAPQPSPRNAGHHPNAASGSGSNARRKAHISTVALLRDSPRRSRKRGSSILRSLNSLSSNSNITSSNSNQGITIVPRHPGVNTRLRQTKRGRQAHIPQVRSLVKQVDHLSSSSSNSGNSHRNRNSSHNDNRIRSLRLDKALRKATIGVGLLLLRMVSMDTTLITRSKKRELTKEEYEKLKQQVMTYEKDQYDKYLMQQDRQGYEQAFNTKISVLKRKTQYMVGMVKLQQYVHGLKSAVRHYVACLDRVPNDREKQVHYKAKIEEFQSYIADIENPTNLRRRHNKANSHKQHKGARHIQCRVVLRKLKLTQLLVLLSQMHLARMR
ncbi:Hypothetical Protein FCC1311_100632 [Hondaea fermentalgiana]|uniref:Uncharacterized protein n=1 Tax=Hondaea fermentalgiana TaxID=2315210 RepID=A0A2R5GSM1_9STRA|nr:Hypothetical Protein FCC1311_100632 [Hondaea fermentalgiana]|eukprot:GBG33840.1 Hypothetical Protein FCC1311_100632 [Hondaea fermentalgiana]